MASSGGGNGRAWHRQEGTKAEVGGTVFFAAATAGSGGVGQQRWQQQWQESGGEGCGINGSKNIYGFVAQKNLMRGTYVSCLM